MGSGVIGSQQSVRGVSFLSRKSVEKSSRTTCQKRQCYMPTPLTASVAQQSPRMCGIALHHQHASSENKAGRTCSCTKDEHESLSPQHPGSNSPRRISLRRNSWTQQQYLNAPPTADLNGKVTRTNKFPHTIAWINTEKQYGPVESRRGSVHSLSSFLSDLSKNRSHQMQTAVGASPLTAR